VADEEGREAAPTVETNANRPGTGLEDAAAQIAGLRRRPCVLLIAPTIDRAIVARLRDALAPVAAPAIDVILFSHGGDIGAAYLLARELRRCAETISVFVPLFAKSAATLVCLAADELVLGPLGELGPLDAQRNTNVPADTSRLVPFKALEQIDEAVFDSYGKLVARIIKDNGVTPLEACTKASELTSALYGPIVASVDPIRIAESARGLELASQYACRLFRRYRGELHDHGCRIVHRLIHGYPSHGFVIDLEELRDLELPARGPTSEEAPIVDALTRLLMGHDEGPPLIEVVPAAE
jgi:hypothetical protein